MSSHDARTDDIAAGLAGLGFSPRVTDHGDHTRIETEVPRPTSVEAWGDLLALLEGADWFGLVSSARHGLIAWAAVQKDAPAAGEAVATGGHCRQLYGS